jgi:hypothetical protein
VAELQPKLKDFISMRPGLRLLPTLFLLLATLLFSGCQSVTVSSHRQYSRFIGLEDFAAIAKARHDSGEIVWLSPEINPGMTWNQLVVSWNAGAPTGSFLKLEAAAGSDGRQTKFYTLGCWSPDGTVFPRTSVRGQEDADGTVDTDTLVLTHPADSAQIRIVLGGTNGALPMLKFLGLSFCNTRAPAAARPPNRAAWGKTIATPERSQHGYPGENGWCSPASLSMVLARWASVLGRPELDLTVPQAAAAVYDTNYTGTGNWPFNTALAGSFSGMSSYVTRFDDLSEVEDWIAADIPVILSVRWDQLEPGRPPDAEGHLVVCIGFTKNGDVVVNDPAAHPDRGESVQRIYRRENVMRAWEKSHHAVYLVYPEDAKIPPNKHGHW